MYIQKNKTAKTTNYYLCKSFRDPQTGKTKTKVVENLGTKEQLREKLGKNVDIDKWLKDYAKKQSVEKETSYSFVKRTINPNSQTQKNIGYLFIKKICIDIGLKSICKKITTKENSDVDLFGILLCIICRDIIEDSAQNSLFEFSKRFFETKNLDYDEVTKALKLLVKYNSFIQKSVYKKICKLLNVNTDKIYYASSNYSIASSTVDFSKLENSEADNFTIGRVFFDNNCIPCGFLIENENFDLDQDNTDILKSIKYKFANASLYTLPESVKTPKDKKIFNKFKNHTVISTYPKDALYKKDINWGYDHSGWSIDGSDKIYNIDEIDSDILRNNLSQADSNKFMASAFFKNKEIKLRDGSKKNLCFFYNIESRMWIREFKSVYLRWYQQLLEEHIHSSHNKDIAMDKIKNVSADVDADMNLFYYFDSGQTPLWTENDGINFLCEDIDPDILKIIYLNTITKFFQLDFYLSLFKGESAINKDLSYKERIVSYYLSSFISVVVYKVLDYYLKQNNFKFWEKDVKKQLNTLDFCQLSTDVWTPQYKVNDLTLALQKIFDVQLDYNFFTNNDIKALIDKLSR